jgi:hypothetical protein
MKNIKTLASRLIEDEQIQDDDILRVQVVPTEIYSMTGNTGWEKQAQKYGVQDKLYDRPDIEI